MAIPGHPVQSLPLASIPPVVFLSDGRLLLLDTSKDGTLLTDRQPLTFLNNTISSRFLKLLDNVNQNKASYHLHSGENKPFTLFMVFPPLLFFFCNSDHCLDIASHRISPRLSALTSCSSSTQITGLI